MPRAARVTLLADTKGVVDISTAAPYGHLAREPLRTSAPELFLFSTDVRLIREAIAGGAAGVVVDWEQIGKAERQQGFDTQISENGPEDLARVRAATDAPVICRINPVHRDTRDEVRLAISLGADEILVPMVRLPHEVEFVLEAARGRVGVGIMLETTDAVQRSEHLASMPLCRVYVGLHDLAIDRGCPNPFRALIDGTIDAVRPLFRCPFGVAGLTLPGRGFPIPSELILHALLRLRCDFTFLRRSFLRDVAGRDVRASVVHLCEYAKRASESPAPQHEEFFPAFARAVVAADTWFRNRNGRG